MEYIKDQEELDAIYQDIQKEIEEKSLYQQSIRTFDFKQPDRITRNAKKIIENIQDNFSKEVASHLNNKLRANVNIQLVSLSQQSLSEFIEGMDIQSCFYVFRINEYDREAVLEIHPHLAFYIVDRVMGGPGHGNQLDRELTKIEQIIMKQVVAEILEINRVAWSRIVSFTIGSQNYYSSSNYIQFAKTGETIVSVTFEVSIEDTQSMLVLSYPYYLINDLVPDISSDSEKNQVSNVRSKALINKNLETSKTPISVNLGQSKLSLKDLINLKNGDVILLNKQTTDNLELIVGKKPRFYGKAGIIKNRFAFKVAQRSQS